MVADGPRPVHWTLFSRYYPLDNCFLISILLNNITQVLCLLYRLMAGLMAAMSTVRSPPQRLLDDCLESQPFNPFDHVHWTLASLDNVKWIIQLPTGSGSCCWSLMRAILGFSIGDFQFEWFKWIRPFLANRSVFICDSFWFLRSIRLDTVGLFAKSLRLKFSH